MGPSSSPWRSSQTPSHPHGGEPAIVAFRRPGVEPPPEPPHEDAASDDVAEGEAVPVLLQLPDLRQGPVAAAKPAATPTQQTWVGKATWIATGCMAIVAVLLIATEPKDVPRKANEAPRWSAAPAAAAAPVAPSVHQPVPNWKLPIEHTPQNPSPGQGAMPNHESRAAAQPAASATHGVDMSGAAEQPAWGAPAESANPQDYSEGVSDGTPQHDGAAGDLSPPGAPASGAAPGNPNSNGPNSNDPWPGDPRWPAESRSIGPPNTPPTRTAYRPGEARRDGSSPRAGEARFEGGIRNIDVSPSYDGTRSSIH